MQATAIWRSSMNVVSEYLNGSCPKCSVSRPAPATEAEQTGSTFGTRWNRKMLRQEKSGSGITMVIGERERPER